MPGRSAARLSIPKRGAARALDRLALGLGLVGLYVLGVLAAALSAPGLLGPLGLYGSIAGLVLSYGIYSFSRRVGSRRGIAAALVLLVAVAAKPLAVVAPFYAVVVDMLLLVAAGAALHEASRLEGLHPRVAARLDRVGGLVVLSSFLLVARLPGVTALAMLVAGGVLLYAYVLLEASVRRPRG